MEHPKDQITDLSLTDVLRRVGLPLELPYARDISGVRCIDYCVDAFKSGCDETTAYYTSGAPFQAALKRAEDAEDLVEELRQDRDSILQSNKTLAKDNLSISAENQRLAALNADYQKRINEMEDRVEEIVEDRVEEIVEDRVEEIVEDRVEEIVEERTARLKSELAREHLKVIHDHEIKNQDEVTKLHGISQRQKECLGTKNSRIQELNGIVSALRKRLENAKRHYRLVVAQRKEAANRADCMEDRWRKALELGARIEADVRATLEKQHAAEVTKLHATIQQFKSDLQQAEVGYKKMRENRDDALSRLSNTEAWLTDFFE